MFQLFNRRSRVLCNPELPPAHADAERSLQRLAAQQRLRHPMHRAPRKVRA